MCGFGTVYKSLNHVRWSVWLCFTFFHLTGVTFSSTKFTKREFKLLKEKESWEKGFRKQSWNHRQRGQKTFHHDGAHSQDQMSDPGFVFLLTTDETSLGSAPTLSEYTIKVTFTRVHTLVGTHERISVQYLIEVCLWRQYSQYCNNKNNIELGVMLKVRHVYSDKNVSSGWAVCGALFQEKTLYVKTPWFNFFCVDSHMTNGAVFVSWTLLCDHFFFLPEALKHQ